MKASDRQNDPLSHRSLLRGDSTKKKKEKMEGVTHRLLKSFQKNVGEVGAEDVAALNTITAAQLKREGVTVTPKDIIDTTRAVMSDSGADPTRAVEELKRKK